MDKRKQFTLTKHPAHLWIGNQTDKIAIQTLKELFCSEKCACTICQQIEQHQHPAILWIKPDKMYTLADIEPLFEIIKFSLQPDNHFIFVFQKADYLSTAVANRLLKIIEEPPVGYHMLFLAARQEQVIPTIRSRCMIQLFDQKKDNAFAQSIARFFMQLPLPEPATFLHTLEKIEINEQETFECIDQLFAYWQTVPEHNKYKNHMINVLKQALEKPPMPGSTKLFWKNFYLQISNNYD